MKFSASFVILACALVKSTIALPLDMENMELVERDYEGYDLEARDYYDVYEERSFDDFEERDLNARAPPKKSTKTGTTPKETKPASKPSASKSCKSIPKKGGSSKKTRSIMYGRETTGKTITLGGKSYLLGDEISGNSGSKTFMVGSNLFAKRPGREGAAPADFAKEVENTKAASTALDNGLFVAEGTSNKYAWLVTKKAPGVEIMIRWAMNPTIYATKKSCEDDMAAAKLVIKAQLEKMKPAGFVHGDNHPGNWYVNESGSITTASPIDFGMVQPTTMSLDTLLTQFTYNAAGWKSIQDCYSVCK